VLRLRAGGMSKRKIAASLSIGMMAAGDRIRRTKRAGLSWPLPEGPERCDAGAACIPAAADHSEGSATAAGLGGGSSRAASVGRDAAAVVGGASRRAFRRIRLQPVLRALLRLGGTPVADHAASACRWRADVRGLCLHDLEVVDRTTGEVRVCQLFVAVLGASYAQVRIMEAACGRALEIGARSFTSVNSILKNNRGGDLDTRMSSRRERR
jgi:hypothetical protein